MAEKEQFNGCRPKHAAEASKENVAETERKTMTPWEQHSAVISIPRFDYNAPSALLHHRQSGFLITCAIKREKSATKEAISILEKYSQYFSNSTPETSESSDENETSKRRKVCTEDIDYKSVEDEGRSTDEHVNGTSTISTSSGAKVEKCSPISLVKLTRSGLLLLTFAKDISPDTVYIVSDLIQSLEAGTLKSPTWCHRIFPIQSTCCLNENDLRGVVSKLVLQFMKDKGNSLSHPVKFAVGYNRRGIEETEMKTSKDSSGAIVMGRDKCFSAVAAAVKDVVSNAIVDLKSPELCILIELLPLSGLPLESLVVGVSVLPSNLVTTKPRLCIKALTSDPKAKS
ncbi:uncharacterized protein LOC111810722 isoform X2 [Cucurbita pepo subsp. pepo]|uniref:uncharacterized protein LOC111810722 isoform X2 n=1 Tax=Cucurbita pepo subsp. pepo TaxID=3664 RepID=UPI000C9D2BCE|nr:uncharacterized protein LOC111810722 isoform X2 [Cucurbita pepo subsp. pepo]